MPTLCVWIACRVPRITAFSVSSYETALGRWCTREVCTPYDPEEYPFARSVRHFMKHVSFDKDSDYLITLKLEVYGSASSQKPQQWFSLSHTQPSTQRLNVWTLLQAGNTYASRGLPLRCPQLNCSAYFTLFCFPVTRLCLANFVVHHFKKDGKNKKTNVRKNISIWKSEVTTEWRWLLNADSLFVDFTW